MSPFVRTTSTIGIRLLVVVLIEASLVTGVLARGIAEFHVTARPPSQRSVWDGVYSKEQVARGRVSYQRSCGYCHMDNLGGSGGDEPGPTPPGLAGRAFLRRWRAVSAAELFTTVLETMPKNRPSLDVQTYADILSFILQANGATPGTCELSADLETLQGIVIMDKPAGESAW